jgi:hypothetical protein
LQLFIISFISHTHSKKRYDQILKKPIKKKKDEGRKERRLKSDE